MATNADETSPSGNGVDLAWTRGSATGPVIRMKLGAVFVRHGGGPARRVTPPGTLAASGGMDGRTLVVEVVREGNSDLELYDLRTHHARRPPPGVNTRTWEWQGSVSGRRLLFGRLRGRGNPYTYDVVLADLVTGRMRMLDSVGTHASAAAPGQVNGRWAVWVCRESLCVVYRFDAETGVRVRIDGDAAHAAFAPSVAANGEVYYGREPPACGRDLQIVRRRPPGARHAVTTLPAGYDLDFTFVAGKRLLFDRVSCTHGNFDVYGVPIGS